MQKYNFTQLCMIEITYVNAMRKWQFKTVISEVPRSITVNLLKKIAFMYLDFVSNDRSTDHMQMTRKYGVQF